MLLWLLLGLIFVLAGVAFYAADTIEQWIPGWKHTVVGLFTAITSGLTSIATLLQGQDGAIAILLKDHPQILPMVPLVLGLLILILGWVTPRTGV